jgi:hypothetical protein
MRLSDGSESKIHEFWPCREPNPGRPVALLNYFIHKIDTTLLNNVINEI